MYDNFIDENGDLNQANLKYTNLYVRFIIFIFKNLFHLHLGHSFLGSVH